MPRAASRRLAARRGRRAISIGRGFVLSRCRPETAIAWSRRGLGAATVAPLEGWTVVMPTGPARARYPYDDAVTSLAGRPAGLWMRPAIGVFQLGRQAVLTVHPDAWRAVQRWAIWTPRDGLVAPIGLAAARPADLVAAAGLLEESGRAPTTGEAGQGGHRDGRDAASTDGRLAATGSTGPAADAPARLRAVLRDGDNDATGVLARVLDILELPGAQLLTGEVSVEDLPGARLVEPAGRHARAFDRLVSDEARHRIEMEA